ncbi:hypothetical protein SLEP1_g17103 [Rubroshorea leprosula]|uniref:Uncharacterized protein n=1 Tax=Rubroshorea leprosula TaxID=152421 RepID=A0AAV5J205_9ROSI|nr:hypothetical protein SLEP1_g17103 [Rubroshorea leprosula]
MIQLIQIQYGSLDSANYFLIIRFGRRLLLAQIPTSDFTGLLLVSKFLLNIIQCQGIAEVQRFIVNWC